MDHIAAGRDQDVPEFTNIFHTLRTQLGIKDSELHLVLKYRGCLHRYIQEEMGFLNISSLSTAYRYAVKIEQKFKQKKRDFGSANQKPKGDPRQPVEAARKEQHHEAEEGHRKVV